MKRNKLNWILSVLAPNPDIFLEKEGFVVINVKCAI